MRRRLLFERPVVRAAILIRRTLFATRPTAPAGEIAKVFLEGHGFRACQDAILELGRRNRRPSFWRRGVAPQPRLNFEADWRIAGAKAGVIPPFDTSDGGRLESSLGKYLTAATTQTVLDSTRAQANESCRAFPIDVSINRGNSIGETLRAAKLG
jgi:hypothetical protein